MSRETDRPPVDPDGMLALSVVFTHQSLHYMSKSCPHVTLVSAAMLNG